MLDALVQAVEEEEEEGEEDCKVVAVSSLVEEAI